MRSILLVLILLLPELDLFGAFLFGLLSHSYTQYKACHFYKLKHRHTKT